MAMVKIDDSKKLSSFKELNLPSLQKIISLYEIRSKNNVLIWTDNGKNSLAPVIAKSLRTLLLQSKCNVSIIVEKPSKELGPASKITQKAILSLGLEDVFISIGSANRGYVEEAGPAAKKGTEKAHILMRTLMEKQGFKMVSIGGLSSLKSNKVNEFLASFDHDVTELKNLNRKLRILMQKTSYIKVTCPAGTDLLVELDQKRKIMSNDGNWKDYSTNYPVGEVYAAPVESSANGVAFATSIKITGQTILAKKPVKFVFDNGLLTSVDSKEVEKNLEYVEKFNKEKGVLHSRTASRTIAEFGIGTNKRAKVVGAMICDEKAYGTCHFAYGNNKHLGGENYCHGHFDNVIVKPSIWFDGVKVMEDGELLI